MFIRQTQHQSNIYLDLLISHIESISTIKNLPHFIKE